MVRESATCTALAVVRPSLGKRKTEEVGGQDISPYAARLPKFQATGNYYDKQAAGQDYHELQEIITGCQRNRSLIRILYGEYTEAQRMTTQGPLLDMAVCFQPEAKTIYNLPDEFVCPWLKKNTDLTSDQLVRIRSKDPKSPHKMLCYKVQLPETFRLEGELQNISLCEHFLDKREKDMGFRMSAPAKSKHVGEDGGVFWLDCSSWRTVFSESFLKTVTYVPTGDVVEVDIDELAVKETWSPVNFHLDLQAAYQYKKCTGTPVHLVQPGVESDRAVEAADIRDRRQEGEQGVRCECCRRVLGHHRSWLGSKRAHCCGVTKNRVGSFRILRFSFFAWGDRVNHFLSSSHKGFPDRRRLLTHPPVSPLPCPGIVPRT